MDNYLALRPMAEEETIKFTMLHLDGVAHEWWYHGLVTLGHRSITTYDEFTTRLIERFEKKDPEIHFRELAQLKQYGTIDAYIVEFQRLSVMVTGITERRLVILFSEGLTEPLKGWIKAFDPPTLQEAMKKARNMEWAAPKAKFQSNSPFQKRDKGKRPQHRPPLRPQHKEFKHHNPHVTRLDPETLNELRRKGLCFRCREKWSQDHVCPKGVKFNQIEYYSASESSSNFSDQQFDFEESEVERAPEEFGDEKESGGVLAQLSSFQRNESFKVQGMIKGQRIVALIDTGATHNFIDEVVVAKKGLQTEEFEGFKVMVADGFHISCTKKILNLKMQLGNYEVKDDFYVVHIGDTDVVLGIQWLRSLGEISLNLQTMELKFQSDGKKIVLRGMSNGGPRVVSFKRMARLICHDQAEWVAECMILPASPVETKRDHPPDVQSLLTKKSKVFADLPPGPPPERGSEHIIELKEGAKPVITTPYRYPKRQKDEIEKNIQELLEMGFIRPSKSPFASVVVLVKKKDVMPFGLNNAPATFQSCMNRIFQNQLRRFVLIFFDDILIYNKTWEDHLKHLEEVLSILESESLFAKASKCEFGMEELLYLGHIISAEGVKVDPEKIKAVVEWPPPENLTQLKGFLGLCGFYRRFVKGYSQNAAPLTDLTKKGAFCWSEKAQIIFDKFKKIMSSCPVLAIPDFSKPFELRCDASGEGVGAVLMQDKHPIVFESRKLRGVERTYSIYDKEMLAIMHALAKFRQYLVGNKFVVKTDHNRLKHFMHQKDLNERQQKWPYRQSTLKKSGVEKLKPRFYGPFRVIRKVGAVAYELELPSDSRVHNVFHVSRLKKALGHNVVASSQLPPLDEEGQLVLIPEEILDFRERSLRKRTIREYLVKWKNLPMEDATWESDEILQHSGMIEELS
ncbi:uncharacterized protein LOC131056314 [Cryptomeria japonica]|uniref:uncharacterized protein LOC131056314 n=1 Tax=Cryptomeria japonica TaxID=3369 RepID=UPI0027DA5CE8|nr:uncharacterized protein LOC131056314 [Cryptomeria japonica]